MDYVGAIGIGAVAYVMFTIGTVRKKTETIFILYGWKIALSK